MLRALFRDTVLANAVMPYVPDGLELALDGYASDRHAHGPAHADPLVPCSLTPALFPRFALA